MSNQVPKFLPPNYRPPEPSKVDPLEGCYLKIERANKHIRDLEASTPVYAKNNAIDIGQYFDDRTDQIVFYFNGIVVPPPPLDFSIVIGEAIHQLRSALDHLVHALFIDRGLIPSIKTQFPIFDDPHKYKSGFKGQIQGTNGALYGSALTRIDMLQPVCRGASANLDPLAILAKMDNTDKHRLLLVSGLLTAGCEISAKDPLTKQAWTLKSPLGPIVIENRTEFLRHGFHLYSRDGRRRRVVPRVEVDVNTHLIASIAVKNVQSGQYEPVIPFLSQLSAFVRNVISGFAGEF